MVDEKFIMDGFNRVLDAMDNLERRFNERMDNLEQHFNERMDALEQRMDKAEADITELKQGQQMIMERLDKIDDRFEIVLEMYGEHEMELRDIRKRLRRLESNHTSIIREDDTYGDD